MRDDRAKQQRYFELGESCFWLSGQNILVEDELRPRLEATAPPRTPPRILDVGCGPGNTLRRLARWGTAVGFDFSPDALGFARGKGLGRVVSGDSTALPIQSGSIDCVVALDVIEHVADDGAALREIARVLRPGGSFLLTVPASMALWRYHDVAYGHFRRYRRRELVERVRDAGLTIEACDFFKSLFFLPLWILARLEALGLLPRRDNFYAVPRWLNAVLESAIVWERRSGLAGRLPFGVALMCVGRR